MFYNGTYAEVPCKKKSRSSKDKEIMAEVMRGFGFDFNLFGVVCLFRGAGGVEVSGGGTLYMKWGAENKFSQARFMGRENILFYKIRFYKIKCKM